MLVERNRRGQHLGPRPATAPSRLAVGGVTAAPPQRPGSQPSVRASEPPSPCRAATPDGRHVEPSLAPPRDADVARALCGLQLLSLIPPSFADEALERPEGLIRAAWPSVRRDPQALAALYWVGGGRGAGHAAWRRWERRIAEHMADAYVASPEGLAFCRGEAFLDRSAMREYDLPLLLSRRWAKAASVAEPAAPEVASAPGPAPGAPALDQAERVANHGAAWRRRLLALLAWLRPDPGTRRAA